MLWVHSKCVKETFINTPYTCINCRSIANDIKTVIKQVTFLASKIDSLNSELNNLRKSHEKLTNEFHDVKQESDHTKQENVKLKTELLTIRAEIQEKNWPVMPKDNPLTLLVGSSLLRDIDPEKLLNTDVHSISGGSLLNVKDYISDTPAGKYGRIVIVAGGNDCEDSSRSVENITHDFKVIAKLALEKTKKKCNDF